MSRLRIVAGEFKGRRINVPPGPRVRPTADRVREALFSILGETVLRARVLDAYSGSGGLGFEALSRGARLAVFIESDRRAVDVLRKNAEGLGVADRCTILQGRVLAVLGGNARCGPFDLVLADPPYASDQAARFLPVAAGHLAARGLIVLETDARREPPIAVTPGLQLARSSRYGRNRLDFYSPASGPAPTGPS